MRRLGAPILLLAAALSTGSALAHASAAGASAPTGRLLVLLRTPPAASGAHAAAAGRVRAAGARLDGPAVPEIGLVTVRPAPGESLHAAALRLAADPAFASVQVEERARPRLTPNDPALRDSDPRAQGTTKLQWAPLREGFPAAWSISRGVGARVAVIDTGIFAAHPDLQGKIAFAAPHDADDSSGHGTHVASLACADTNNGRGIAGAGYACRLVVERTSFTDASVAASIVDAVKRGAQVINMSFGTDSDRSNAPDAIRRAIDYALRHRAVLVAAAADDDVREQGYPANVLQPAGTGPRLGEGKGLSVTAADYDDHRADFAGRGTEISMAAYGAYRPGGTVLEPPGLLGALPPPAPPGAPPSTDFESGRTYLTSDNSNDYGYLEGTSMAAPQVAGAAALIRTLNPDLRSLEVVRILKETARRSGGWSDDLGWGILDAGAAVRRAQRTDRRAPTSTLRSTRAVRARRVDLRWTGADRSPAQVLASGIARVEVYAFRGHGRPRLIARLPPSRHTLRFTARSHARYGFYTRAVDVAGNREAAPRRPDVSAVT